jgi:hypothetical protein
MNASSPILYEDSLNLRAAPLKYRRIGNPYAFLNAIGIDAVLEYIYKGNNIVGVAEQLGISITILLNWAENEGHMQKLEDAHKFSAEGYLHEAATLLRTARTEFDLKKADKVANHGRFMASKLDKSKYGADNKTQGNTAGVTFVMHMGDRTATVSLQNDTYKQVPPPAEAGFINGTYKLADESALEDALFTTPAHVLPPDDIGPFEPEPFFPELDEKPDYLP